jgi:hypothetical protein
MTEQWAQVPGWEGFYEVSDLGRVRSMARSVPGRPGVLINLRTNILRPTENTSGYLVVAFSRDGRKYEQAVHCLVLSAFVCPRPDGLEGCHNNGDKANNSVGNLRWDTRSANTLDRVEHGTHMWASKTECPAGHLYTVENTYLYRGSRNCKTCKRDRKNAARLVKEAVR